jgi:hypothetical protein
MDELKQRFRALDRIRFPHEAGPPAPRRVAAVPVTSGARRASALAAAAVLGAAALALAFGALGGLTDRPEPGVVAGGSGSPSPSATGSRDTVRVPHLVGLSEQEAMLALNEHGLRSLPAYREVDGVAEWHVSSTDPVAGTSVDQGATVRLVISSRITPLPAGAAEALDCAPAERVPFGGPNARIEPGGAAYIVGNLAGIHRRSDEVVQITFDDEQWHGLWHVVRDGAVVAVVDYASLDGEACEGSEVVGA